MSFQSTALCGLGQVLGEIDAVASARGMGSALQAQGVPVQELASEADGLEQQPFCQLKTITEPGVEATADCQFSFDSAFGAVILAVENAVTDAAKSIGQQFSLADVIASGLAAAGEFAKEIAEKTESIARGVLDGFEGFWKLCLPMAAVPIIGNAVVGLVQQLACKMLQLLSQLMECRNRCLEELFRCAAFDVESAIQCEVPRCPEPVKPEETEKVAQECLPPGSPEEPKKSPALPEKPSGTPATPGSGGAGTGEPGVVKPDSGVAISESSVGSTAAKVGFPKLALGVDASASASAASSLSAAMAGAVSHTANAVGHLAGAAAVGAEAMAKGLLNLELNVDCDISVQCEAPQGGVTVEGSVEAECPPLSAPETPAVPDAVPEPQPEPCPESESEPEPKPVPEPAPSEPVPSEEITPEEKFAAQPEPEMPAKKKIMMEQAANTSEPVVAPMEAPVRSEPLVAEVIEAEVGTGGARNEAVNVPHSSSW